MDIQKIIQDGNAALVKADGEITAIKPENGKAFSMEELYRHIDCQTFENIRLNTRDTLMIGDEEGRLYESAQVNQAATDFYRESWGITDPVAQWKEQVEQMRSAGVIGVFDDDFPPYSVVGNVLVMPQTMLD